MCCIVATLTYARCPPGQTALYRRGGPPGRWGDPWSRRRPGRCRHLSAPPPLQSRWRSASRPRRGRSFLTEVVLHVRDDQASFHDTRLSGDTEHSGTTLAVGCRRLSGTPQSGTVTRHPCRRRRCPHRAFGEHLQRLQLDRFRGQLPAQLGGHLLPHVPDRWAEGAHERW